MITNTLIALMTATPTTGVRSDACLMAKDKTSGRVLGVKVMTSKSKVRSTLVFHIWDNFQEQKQDKNLKASLKKLVKAIGAAHIWEFNASKDIEALNNLLEAADMETLDRPTAPITLLLDDSFENMEALTLNLAIPSSDRVQMYVSSLVALDVLEVAWKRYFKTKLEDQVLIEEEFEENDWTNLLSTLDKRVVKQQTNEKTELQAALSLLRTKGISETIIERLGCIGIDNGI